MFPPIFEVCAADANVQSNLGTSPCRLYPFGEAPSQTEKPYAVWNTVVGVPELNLDQPPDIEQFTIQVDVYADTADAVRDAAQALRDAIETRAHVTGFSGERRDPDTRLYHYPLDVDWFVSRESVS